MTPNIDIRSSARMVSLVRILLFALSVGIIFFLGIIELASILGDRQSILTGLLIGVALAAIVLAFAANWVEKPRTLIFHLVFDMLWVSAVVYLCGGVLGPASLLAFAVVILACLVLPGVYPFLFSSLASVLLIAIAILYAQGMAPYEDNSAFVNGDIANTELIFSTTVVQVFALFLIDILGQVLARRVNEQQIIVGDLLDQIGDGVVLVDLRGRIRHMNDQARVFLGIDPETDCEGRDVRSLLESEEAQLLQKVLVSGKGLSSQHVKIKNKYILATANDVHGRKKMNYGRMLSLRDESSLRNLEENMRRAEHLASLGELAAGIAHEFRNPLTSLRGCAQEISDISQEGGAVQSCKLSKIIIRESDRLSHIVEDILGFSRQHSLYLQGMNVLDFFEDVLEYYEHREDLDGSIAIHIDVAVDCPRIFSDPEKLRQIITNLIDNSIHASHGLESAQIILRAKPIQHKLLDVGAHSVCLSIEDQGTGIDPEQIRHIFTPFFSTRSQGTGIGLALVQRLVRALGGVIKIESELGIGTQAYVYIPQVEDTSKSGLIDISR